MPCHGFGSLSCLVHLLAKRPKVSAGIVMGRMATQRAGDIPSRYRAQQVPSAQGSPLFGTLPESHSRWKLFLTTWSVQAVVVLCLVNLGVLFPGMFSAATKKARYAVTNLVSYQPPIPHQPQPVNSRLMLKPERAEPAPTVSRLVVPLPEHKLRQVEVKAPDLKLENKFPALPNSPSPKVVATDTFSTGSSAPATTNRPASAVQTGGFGDPNGVQARDNRGAANIIAMGSFDLPSGSGYGNGSGGANPGVVVSSGFGNGVAIGNPKSGGAVQQSGFDLKRSASDSSKVSLISAPGSTPVQILAKPNPEYTEEGRRLKIDGEVRLEVLFSAAGQARVMRILQGLGHGLDEEAVKAAEQIRFKPASHQGQPVDSTAVVRIIFQLAS